MSDEYEDLMAGDEYFDLSTAVKEYEYTEEYADLDQLNYIP